MIITSDTTWQSGTYELGSQIIEIAQGVTLTIKPGAVINGGDIPAYGTLSLAGRPSSIVTLNNTTIGTREYQGQVHVDGTYMTGGQFFPAGGGAASFTLKNSVIDSVKSDIHVWYPEIRVVIKNNRFIQSAGLSIGTKSGNEVTIKNNLFEDWSVVWYRESLIENWAAYGGSSTVVYGNSFMDSGRVALSLKSGPDSTAMIANGNYWGTTDENVIQNMILDRNDSLSRASIIPFQPFLNQSLFGSSSEVLMGTPQANKMEGFGGDDSLTGLGGADTLVGGAGNDTMDGGADSDLAVFSSIISAYRFALDGNTLIVSGPDGIDRLSNIETLSFGAAAPVLVRSLQPAQIEELITVQQSGVVTKLLPDIYSGPVAWLKYQMIGSGLDEVAIGTSKNDFFNLLGGDDAANGGAGDDVLDGGTGSNFLSGGTGRDDFFLDGRGANTTWATITDWEAGERLSVWGWRPGVSKVIWVDSAGAQGWTGATMHGDLDGNGVIDTSVTWTGLSQQQLPKPLEFDGLLWFT
jgi:Ca2+-binding RTX toxin-like protein